MKKLCFILLLFIAIDVSAWTITTNYPYKTDKYTHSFTVVTTSSDLTYGSTNWQMPKRLPGRAIPRDITVTYLSNAGAFPFYIRCTVVTSLTLNFKLFRVNANAPSYTKSVIKLDLPAVK